MKKIWLIGLGVLGIGVLCIILTAVWVFQQMQPVQPVGEADLQRFVVRPGQSVSGIASNLQAQGLIKNELIFRLTVQAQGIENDLQAGSFEVSPSSNVIEIAQALTQGTSDTWLTIPEGLRREEIAELLDSKMELTEFNADEFLQLTIGLEGQLFPDTYLVPTASTTQSIVNILHNTFEQRVATLDRPPTSAELVLASLVQREARTSEQMREVAGILLNRLAIGMPLQVDATLQYAKGEATNGGSWWATPLAVDKQIDSPFNTYLNAELPPQPIANPGMDALSAVINPAETENLFYIHAPDGTMHTAEDLAGHNANINAYLR